MLPAGSKCWRGGTGTALQEQEQLVKDYLLQDYLLNKEKFGILETTNSNQKKQINPTGLTGKAACTLMSRHTAEEHEWFYLDDFI